MLILESQDNQHYHYNDDCRIQWTYGNVEKDDDVKIPVYVGPTDTKEYDDDIGK
jgi:hypothetical protein